MNLLSAALRYRNQLSYSVIPISQQKKPLIKWEQFQKRIATEQEIRDWWTKFPEANIGIVTGIISGIAVIDIDEPEAAKPILSELIPDCLVFPIAKTPSGGEHWYFACTDSKLTNNARLIAGADLRANGGYVVAPPSINGNGRGWKWVEDLSPTKIALPFLPVQYKNAVSVKHTTLVDNYTNKSINNSIIEREKENIESVVVSQVSSNQQMFISGKRDEDLFHVANCLFKGKMPEPEVLQVLEKLALSCSPPFDLKEIPAKIESAKKRVLSRERNIAEDLRDWIEVSSGQFKVSDYQRESVLISKTEKHAANVEISKLVKLGIIEKFGDMRGVYRKVDAESQNIDWYNTSVDNIDIKYPFGIEEFVHTMPRNIVVVAGSPNAGKSAFLLNVVAMNMEKFKINYFSSEMGAMELRSRLQKFDFPISKWRFTAKERSHNFADVIKPEEINIIDFMELSEDFWKVGGMLRAVYDRLSTGIAIVALQKAPGATMARGGVGSLEKPRLYITMDSGKIKIEKGKNWAKPEINPNGLTCEFKLVQGCKFIKIDSWSL